MLDNILREILKVWALKWSLELLVSIVDRRWTK